MCTGVVYSPVCETSPEIYKLYLFVVAKYGAGVQFTGCINGTEGSSGCQRRRIDDDSGLDGVDVDEYFRGQVKEVVGVCGDGNVSKHDGDGGSGVCGVESECGVEGVSGGIVGDISGGHDSGVHHGSGGFGERLGSSDTDAASTVKRGKWYSHNKRRKEARRLRSVPVWRRGARPGGTVETVVSSASGVSLPSYDAAVSDARKEERESLARRRVAENAVAEKLAAMKLASLGDAKRCADYDALKKQRIVQWHNESVAKSQASLDKSRSIDPGSSISQSDYREMVKKIRDLEFQQESLIKATVSAVGPERAAEFLRDSKPPGPRTIAEMDDEEAFWCDNKFSLGSVDNYLE